MSATPTDEHHLPQESASRRDSPRRSLRFQREYIGLLHAGCLRYFRVRGLSLLPFRALRG